MKFKAFVSWRRWLPVVLCLLAIAYFSSQPFDEQDLRPEISRHVRVVERVRELPPVRFSYHGQPVDNRHDPVDFIQFWLRKAAHVILYGMFGITLLGALSSAGQNGRRLWLLSAAIVAIVAAMDEWHQTFVPGRTGRLADVLVDMAGFMLFAFCSWLMRLRYFCHCKPS